MTFIIKILDDFSKPYPNWFEFSQAYIQYTEFYKCYKNLYKELENRSELNLHCALLKIYLVQKPINSQQRYILIQYLTRLNTIVKNSHNTSSEDDVNYRAVIIEFLMFCVKYIQILERKSDIKLININTIMVPRIAYLPESTQYGFVDFVFWLYRIVFQFTMHEMNLSNNTQLLIILIHIVNSEYTIHKIDFINYSFNINMNNITSLFIKMYNMYRTDIHFTYYVELAMSFINESIRVRKSFSDIFKKKFNSHHFDSLLLKVLFLFLNHNDNIDDFIDIIFNINSILIHNVVDYNDKIFKELFTPYNLHQISLLPNLFSNEEKEDMQAYVLKLFIYVFNLNIQHQTIFHIEEITVRNFIDELPTSPNLDLLYMIIYFISITFAYYPDLHYESNEKIFIFIRESIHFIIDNEQFSNDLTHSLLNVMLDILLNKENTLYTQRDIIAIMCIEYIHFMRTSKSRMFFSLIVYQFMIASYRHNLEYNSILKDHSNYFSEIEKDDNIYNKCVIKDIKYNLVYTSLEEKCKIYIIDNLDKYSHEQVADVLDFL